MPLAILPCCFSAAQSKNLLLPLPSQGALTHGDRRATESRDLSKYNFENKVTGLGWGSVAERGWEELGEGARGRRIIAGICRQRPAEHQLLAPSCCELRAMVTLKTPTGRWEGRLGRAASPLSPERDLYSVPLGTWEALPQLPPCLVCGLPGVTVFSVVCDTLSCV